MELIKVIYSVPWQPGVGDPTLFCWLTVLAYLAAAVMCGVCARQAQRVFETEPVWPHRFVWGGVGAVLLLLGLAFLARFIILRAAALYAVPLPELSRFTGGFKVTWLLEITGASCVAIAAVHNLHRRSIL